MLSRRLVACKGVALRKGLYLECIPKAIREQVSLHSAHPKDHSGRFLGDRGGKGGGVHSGSCWLSHCRTCLTQGWYNVTERDSKYDLRLLSQNGTTYNCLCRSVTKILYIDGTLSNQQTNFKLKGAYDPTVNHTLLHQGKSKCMYSVYNCNSFPTTTGRLSVLTGTLHFRPNSSIPYST